MKKIVSIIAFACICWGASAISYHPKNDFLFYHNYYNPAARYYQDGIYLQGFASHMFNMPPLAGKEPLDMDFDVMASRKNYTAFASLSHSEYSYFCGLCLSAGGNYIHDFNGSGHKLSIGGRFLLGLNSVDFTRLPYQKPIEDNRSRILPTPDIDLGIEYSYGYFHIGASVKNVFAYEAKYKDVTYVSWPRSYMLILRGDPEFAGGNVKLDPIVALGFNQNIYFLAGMDLTLWKNYRIGYTFRGPDLGHSFNASVMIMDRVGINAGYTISTAHDYSTVHVGLTVRLAK